MTPALRRSIITLAALAVLVLLATPVSASFLTKPQDATNNRYDFTEHDSPTNATNGPAKFSPGYGFDGDNTTSDHHLYNSNATELLDGGPITFTTTYNLFINDREGVLYIGNRATDGSFNNQLFDLRHGSNGTVRYLHKNASGNLYERWGTTQFSNGYHTMVVKRDPVDNRIQVEVDGTMEINDTWSDNLDPRDDSGGTDHICVGVICHDYTNDLNAWEGTVWEVRAWDDVDESWANLRTIVDRNDTTFENELVGTETSMWILEAGNYNVTGSGELNASFTSSCTGTNCTFDASGSTGDITSYDWEFGDGTTGTGQITTHNYASDGTYQVNLTVTNGTGATDTSSTNVTVSNSPPSTTFTWTCEERTCSFDASNSSDPDGTIEEYKWDFGDGTTGFGETVTRTYEERGTFEVQLTTTDDDGATGTDTQTVTTDPLHGGPEDWTHVQIADTAKTWNGRTIGDADPTDPDHIVTALQFDDGQVVTWETHDGGLSWDEQNVTDVTLLGSTHVGFDIHPSDPDRQAVIYWSDTDTGPRLHASISVDGGVAWNHRNINERGNFSNPQSIAIQWIDDDTLVAVVQNEESPSKFCRYMTNNTGVDWGPLSNCFWNTGSDFRGVGPSRALDQVPESPTDLRFLAYGACPKRANSTDGGVTWGPDFCVDQIWDNNGPVGGTILPNQLRYAVQSESGSDLLDVYRSTDGGVSYTKLNRSGGRSIIVDDVDGDDTNVTVSMHGGGNVLAQISNDGGSNWSRAPVTNDSICACARNTAYHRDSFHVTIVSVDETNNDLWAHVLAPQDSTEALACDPVLPLAQLEDACQNYGQLAQDGANTLPEQTSSATKWTDALIWDSADDVDDPLTEANVTSAHQDLNESAYTIAFNIAEHASGQSETLFATACNDGSETVELRHDTDDTLTFVAGTAINSGTDGSLTNVSGTTWSMSFRIQDGRLTWKAYNVSTENGTVVYDASLSTPPSNCLDGASLTTLGTNSDDLTASILDTRAWAGSASIPSPTNLGIIARPGNDLCGTGGVQGDESYVYFLEPYDATIDADCLTAEDPTADKISQGYHNLADIDTDYDVVTPRIWVREEGDQANSLRQNVYALAKDLSVDHSQRICSGSGFEQFDRISHDDGLSVTNNNRPLYICRDAEHGWPALLYGLDDGSWHPDLAPHKVGGSQSAVYIPVDSRTGNKIIWPQSTSFVAQLDIFELESHLKQWEWSDVAISQGDTTHVAFTGPDGTRAMTSIGGSLLAPTLNKAYDSIRIRDGTVWAATATDNVIDRYELTAQTWNQTHALGISHTGSSVLDLSPDGRYLALTRANFVMLYNATTMTQLAALEDDRAGLFRHATISPNNNYVYAITDGDIFRFPVYDHTTNIDGEPGKDGQENPAPSSSLTLEDDDPLGDDDAPIDAGQSQGLTQFFNIVAQGITGPDGNGKAFAGMLLVALAAVGLFFITGHPGAAAFGGFLGVLGAFFLNLFDLWVPITFGIVGAAILVVMSR